MACHLGFKLENDENTVCRPPPNRESLLGLRNVRCVRRERESVGERRKSTRQFVRGKSDGMDEHQPRPSCRSLLGLDAFNVVLADLQTGIGAYLAVFLAGVRHFGPDRIGAAIAAGGFASVVVQIPAGALIDRARYKRLIVAGAGVIGAAAAIILAAADSFALIVAIQVMMAALAVFSPAVGALSLGIVGRDALPKRQGRNQACNGVGNVLFALIEAAIGPFISLGATISAVAGIGLLAATSMLGIRDIDHARAREASSGPAVSLVLLLRDPRVATFAAVVLLFNLSNEGCSSSSDNVAEKRQWAVALSVDRNRRIATHIDRRTDRGGA